jgi:quercetin dioxygenase-like cupin family protein
MVWCTIIKPIQNWDRFHWLTQSLLFTGWWQMSDDMVFIDNLENMIDSFPPDSILSRTIYQDGSLKTILFGFQPGQELSEHTASVPAILHFIKGDARVLLGEEKQNAKAGTWIRIPAELPHSIHAETETLMLLTMIL